jgi:hypothetical protein
MVLLFLADLFRYELNLYVWLLLMVGIVVFQLMGWIGDWQMMFLGALILSSVYYGIYLAAAWRQTRKQGVFTEWFGLGDVWMAWLIGSLVGVVFSKGDLLFWIQIVLLYLVVSSGLGIVFWLLRKAVTRDDEEKMPFMPAMIVAFYLIVVFDTEIMSRFASFL